jgi:hypothetical protein
VEDHAAKRTPIGKSLETLAGQLTRIRNELCLVEEAIEHILVVAKSREGFGRIQQLDRIMQEIDDLARFCGVAGEGLGDTPDLDLAPALAALKLRHMVRAMGHGEPAGYEPAPEDGVHLF